MATTPATVYSKRRIWRIYALALSLLVAIISGSHLLTDWMAAAQSDDARIINLAGLQRMLSQKIAGRIADGARRDEIRAGFLGALYDDINLMAVNHARLTGRTADRVDDTLSDEIKALYFKGAPSVDQRVLIFLEESRALLDEIEAGHPIIEPQLNEYLGSARGRVLADLDRVVAQYVKDPNTRLGRLRALNLALFVLAIAIITLELFLIFRPLAARLERAQQELLDVARTDPLTGCWNRRALMETGEVLRQVERRAKQPFSLIICDIDHFKTVNDTYGHPAGDEVIREFVRRCLDCLRDQDLLGRFGGEEFVALLPGATTDQAARVSERIRSAIERNPIRTDAGSVSVTSSFGLSLVREGDDSLHPAIERADAALYEAKQSGRNQVRRSTSD